PVTISGFALTGTDAGNYTAVQPSGVVADITPASLNITGIGAANKVYDTSVTATLTGTAGVVALGSDAVSVAGTGAGTFTNKHVATAKPVTVSGFTLTGVDAGNYTAVQPSGVVADIT